MEEEKKLQGLRGWLILVGIGIILSPLRILAQVLPCFQMFSDGSWDALTTPGSQAYSPFWTPLIIGEISINGMLVIAWIVMAFLFFSKKKILPAYFIGVIVFSVVFILADALIIKIVLPDEPVFDAQTAKDFIATLTAAIIWVPYMLVSKRVKATFIK